LKGVFVTELRENIGSSLLMKIYFRTGHKKASVKKEAFLLYMAMRFYPTAIFMLQKLYSPC